MKKYLTLMKADSDGSSGINRLGFLHVPKNNKSLIELSRSPAKITDFNLCVL